MDGRWSRLGLNPDAKVNIALLKPRQVPIVGSPELRTPRDRRRAIVSDVKDSEYRISTSLAHQDSLHPYHRSY